MPSSSLPPQDNPDWVDGRIVDRFYTIEDGKIKLHWWLRTTEGKIKVTTPAPFLPYCGVPASYLPILKEVLAKTNLNPKISKFTNTRFADSSAAPYKLEFPFPRQVGEFRRLMERHGYSLIYEGDIGFLDRVMADKDITDVVRIHADNTFEKAPDDATIPPFTIWYWDIETSDEFEGTAPNPETERILTIAYVTDTGVEVVLAEEDEKETLSTFYSSISRFADILVGYNSDKFDEPYFRKRVSVVLEVPETFRGVAFLDLGPILIKSEETTLPSWSLDYIAETKLGERKLPIIKGFHETFRTDRKTLMERCLDDARKLKKLEDAYHYITYTLENLKLSGAPIHKLKYISWVGDAMTLRESIHRCAPRILWRCKGHAGKVGKFKGAIVGDPPLGVHWRVACLDFTSLYVRIMRENWISRSSFRKTPNRTTIKCGENIYYDTKLPAPVPQILERLESDRTRYLSLAKSTKDDTLYKRYDMLQKQRKMSGNAMYGFTGDAKTRYYYKEVAHTVAKLGRDYLIAATDLSQLLSSLRVIYRDTDSVYLKFNADTDYRDIIATCESLIPFINNLCNSLAGERGVPKRQRIIEMKFEAIYDPLIFFRSEKGEVAKKRYVGRQVYSYKKGGLLDEFEIEKKGIEERRGDRSELTKQMQNIIFSHLLSEDISGAIQYIKDTQRKFFKGQLDHLAVLSSSLTKPIAEYKSKPPHFRAAIKAMAQSERLMWGKVQYVYVANGRNGLIVEPVIKGEIPSMKPSGRELFWENRVMKWVKRIMGAVMNEHELEREMSGTSQLDVWFT